MIKFNFNLNYDIKIQIFLYMYLRQFYLVAIFDSAFNSLTDHLNLYFMIFLQSQTTQSKIINEIKTFNPNF